MELLHLFYAFMLFYLMQIVEFVDVIASIHLFSFSVRHKASCNKNYQRYLVYSMKVWNVIYQQFKKEAVYSLLINKHH